MQQQLIRLVGALAMATVFAAPLAAETISECQERVIAHCAQAMEDANWAERIALGVFCTGRLAGCSIRQVNVNLPAQT